MVGSQLWFTVVKGFSQGLGVCFVFLPIHFGWMQKVYRINVLEKYLKEEGL
jgi:hypothetical protein